MEVAAFFHNLNQTDTSKFETWDNLVSLANKPQSISKEKACCMASQLSGQKNKEAVLKHDSMSLCWIDIDEGDLSLYEVVEKLTKLLILSAIIYSTASSNRLNSKGGLNGNRWRALIQLSKAVNCKQWILMQQAITDLTGGDKSATRIQQILFAPNNPEISDPSETRHYEYKVLEGKPLDPESLPEVISTHIALLKQQSELETAKKVSIKAIQLRSQSNDSGDFTIDTANKLLPDIESLLLQYGYIKSGQKYKSPNSSSGMPGVHLFDNGHWLSHHDSDSDIGIQCEGGTTGDAFDLYCHYEHGGNKKKAFAELAKSDPKNKQRQKEYIDSQNSQVSNSDSSELKETPEEAILRLSKLSLLDFTTVKKSEANKLNMSVADLTKLVNQASKEVEQDNDEVVTSDEPYQGEVNGQQLINEIQVLISRHMILPHGALPAISLWIVATYVYNDFRIFPKLSIISPEKRCGKSTLLDIISGLCSRSLLASNITPAAIFRVIEASRPSLLIDEADTFVAGRNDDMIGIINSGHTKNTARVVRLVGDNHEPKVFNTFCPMAFASIKSLPGTVMDRSIAINLRRRMAGEKVQRLSIDFKDHNSIIRQKLTRLADDLHAHLKTNPIEPPEIPNDRAIDNWLPFFTLAHAIGGEWPDKVESSYTILNSMNEEETASIMLLKDIKGVFENRDRTRLHSHDLVNELVKLEERPWCEWKKGKPMTQNSLSKMLGSFSIHSKQLRIGTDKKRGFELDQFSDSFSRYIPTLPDTPIQSGTTVQVNDSNGRSDIQSGTSTNNVPLQKQPEPKPSNVCTTVPLQNPVLGQTVKNEVEF